MLFIRLIFHWLSGPIKSLTHISSIPVQLSGSIRPEGFDRIHLSLKTLIFRPCPTRYRHPPSSTDFVLHTLLYMKLGLLPSFEFMKFAPRKYLAWKTRATSDCGLEIKYQPCLESKARLKFCKSRSPIPPSLRLHKISHLFQLMPLFPSRFVPHQNELNMLWNSSQREVGIMNVLIQYVGIACSTILIRTSFPALDKSLLLQLWILFQSLSFNKLKIAFFDLPISDGKPRYLPVFNEVETPSSVCQVWYWMKAWYLIFGSSLLDPILPHNLSGYLWWFYSLQWKLWKRENYHQQRRDGRY